MKYFSVSVPFPCPGEFNPTKIQSLRQDLYIKNPLNFNASVIQTLHDLFSL